MGAGSGKKNNENEIPPQSPPRVAQPRESGLNLGMDNQARQNIMNQ